MRNNTENFLIEHPAVREVCRQERVGIMWVAEDRLANGFSRSPFSSNWGWPTGLSREQEVEYYKLEDIVKKTGKEPTPEQLKAKETLRAMRMDLLSRTEPELNGILEALAKESGYEEVRYAPLLVLSHSMGGLLCWNMPFWVPERMWGSIPIKTGVRGMPPEEKPDATMGGVPLLYINYFEPEGPGAGLTFQNTSALNPGRKFNFLIGQACDWGGTHHELTDDMANLVALFIRKASKYRLSDEIPANGYPKLKELTPAMGWLATELLEPEQFPMAPEPQYKGDKTKAFWFFDEEMAKAAVNCNLPQRKKNRQFVTVVSNGQKLQPIFKKHSAHIDIPLETALDDGFTFKLTGDFLDTVISENPEEQKPVGHASRGNVIVKLAGGVNIVQLDADTFRYRRFNRGSRANNWLVAFHPGDDEYCRSNFPAFINIPWILKKGKPQQITFPEIKDIPAGTKEIVLGGTSDVEGQEVEYYVVSGPAEVTGKDPRYTGNILRLTPIPPHAKYPVKIIVVAYQMGRNKEPFVQSAPEIVREFYITKP
jgi:hypothetical protein